MRLHLAGVRGKRNAFVDDVSTWIAQSRVRHREDIVQVASITLQHAGGNRINF
jgi:hypothetical protein